MEKGRALERDARLYPAVWARIPDLCFRFGLVLRLLDGLHFALV
jgi:hypothetical protein